MLQTLARQQRVHLRSLLAPALAAQRHAYAATAARAFAAAAAPTPAPAAAAAAPAAGAAAAKPAKAGGKKAEAAAAAAAAAAEKESNTLSVEDEFNQIPPIPKPSSADLEALCLSEEQLRFAKRPMPDATHRRKILPSIYVPEGRLISEHTEADLGSYFEVPESVQRSVPSQIQRTMSQEFMGGGGFMMVRQPGLQIVQGLKAVHEGKTKVAQRVFGVRGASGCGKSAALHYAVQYMREQAELTPEKPWLIVATRGQEFSSEKRGFIAPSTVKEGVYDQALYTMDYFTNMLKTESEALKLISLKRKDKLSTVSWPEGVPGTTLFDLVSLAATDREQAPRLLYDFTAELRLDTEVPVCVMIDNLNIWDQVCEFIEPYTYKPLDPRKLALVDAFDYFTRQAPKNGASIWALTTRHATLANAFKHFSYRPVAGVDAYHYSSQELKHCIVHYSVSEFILSEINQELVVRIAGLTGRVPRDVHQQAFFR